MAKQPPEMQVIANIEAEEAVLGSLLIDAGATIQVTPLLKPGDFYREKHKWIYQAVIDLAERREPVDFVTICDELERKDRLKEVGSAYITSLIGAVPTAMHAEHYARLVAEDALRRQAVDTGARIAGDAYNRELPVESLVDRAQQRVMELAQGSSNGRLVAVGDIMDGLIAHLDELHKAGGGLLGLSSGFQQLDAILGGLKRSDLVVIAARPSVGKTSLAMNIAVKIAQRGGNVGVFSLEMSKQQLLLRMLSVETGIDHKRLSQGDIQAGEWPLLVEGAGALADLSLHIDDASGTTVTEIRARARRLQMERGLDLVVIDYLQLMETGGKPENRTQEISKISRGLKALARELAVPVIVLSQLNRNLEQRNEKRPVLSDLRESGAIEQDADLVLFIYREEMHDPNTTRQNLADVIVAKHRNGPTGTATLYFDKALTRFADLEITREPLEPQM